MDKLRDEFFEKHVSRKTTDGIPVVSTHPHNLFEWFKKNMRGQVLPLCPRCNGNSFSWSRCDNCGYDPFK